MEKVKITTEFIKLEQLLKFTGIAQSGSDAKKLIAAGIVKVNGATELQRGKKLRPGDIMEFEGSRYLVE